MTESCGLYGMDEMLRSSVAFSLEARVAPTTFGVRSVRPSAASKEMARDAGAAAGSAANKRTRIGRLGNIGSSVTQQRACRSPTPTYAPARAILGVPPGR